MAEPPCPLITHPLSQALVSPQVATADVFQGVVKGHMEMQRWLQAMHPGLQPPGLQSPSPILTASHTAAKAWCHGISRVSCLPGLASVEAYSYKTNEWFFVAPMNTRRSSVGVGVVEGKEAAVGVRPYPGPWALCWVWPHDPCFCVAPFFRSLLS